MLSDVQLLTEKILRQRIKEIRRGILEHTRRRLMRIIMLQILMLFISESISFAQQKPSQEMIDLPLPKNVLLSEQDITDTINCFRTDNAEKSVEVFKAKMPPAASDQKFREEVLQRLPSAVKKLRIDDAEIIENFRKLITPVLELYGKDKIYELVIFRHDTPMMFSDSGVVLVVSSGMIRRAAGDDELLGFVAHEVAHEYYAKASVYTKHILGFVTEDNSDHALARKYWESLGLIELQCDSFAALTLARLGYDPLAFIKGLDRVERDFPDFVGGFHPPASVRRRVVEAVIPPKTSSDKTKMSPELRKLKEMFAARQSSRYLEN